MLTLALGQTRFGRDIEALLPYTKAFGLILGLVYRLLKG